MIKICLYDNSCNGVIMTTKLRIVSKETNQNKIPEVLPKTITAIINAAIKHTIPAYFEILKLVCIHFSIVKFSFNLALFDVLYKK